MMICPTFSALNRCIVSAMSFIAYHAGHLSERGQLVYSADSWIEFRSHQALVCGNRPHRGGTHHRLPMGILELLRCCGRPLEMEHCPSPALRLVSSGYLRFMLCLSTHFSGHLQLRTFVRWKIPSRASWKAVMPCLACWLISCVLQSNSVWCWASSSLANLSLPRPGLESAGLAFKGFAQHASALTDRRQSLFMPIHCGYEEWSWVNLVCLAGYAMALQQHPLCCVLIVSQGPLQIAQAMQAEGYFQGAGDETVAVANFETWNNEEQMRFDDEPVKRRIIEFVVSLNLLNTSSSSFSAVLTQSPSCILIRAAINNLSPCLAYRLPFL